MDFYNKENKILNSYNKISKFRKKNFKFGII